MRQMLEEDISIPLHGVGGASGIRESGGVGLGDEADDG